MHDKSKRMQVIRLRETDHHALTRQVMRGGNHMSKDERKQMIEEMAEKFTGLEENDKSFIVGYMTGKQEERQRWEQRQDAVATA